MEYPLNYDSPAALKEYLETKSLSMKKRFGQNFLINRGAREKIVSTLPLKDGSHVWEIGPGLGAMTWHLLDKNSKVTVFEIDHGFASSLKSFYDNIEEFKLVEGDFIKVFKEFSKGHKAKIEEPDFILGNLPYVSGSVMIADIIKSEINPQNMVFTVQKEVGQRMAAKAGGKDYSSFSLICQSKYDVILRGDLNPGSFYPQPSVKSIIVELVAHNKFPEGLDWVYYDLVNDLFLSRRKKISNNLSAGKCSMKYGKDVIINAAEKSGIDLSLRAENLSVENIQNMSRYVLEFSE